MNDKPTWRNKQEADVFSFYQLLLPQLSEMGLDDTYHALELLLKRRIEKDVWNWPLFEDFINLFFNELSLQDPTYRDGIQILYDIFTRTFNIKKKKGKLFNLREVSQSKQELDDIDKSLGVIHEVAYKTENPTIFLLLAGMGHVVRFERKGRFVEKRIHHWANPAYPEKTKRKQLVEKFLMIRTMGSEGLADTRHIRNSFAHGHFRFLSDDVIELWDIGTDGSESFNVSLNTGDLMNIFNMFEKKLQIAFLYPEILISVDSLYRIYNKEWKKGGQHDRV